MHEAALMQGAVQEALAKMREAGGARITRVVLTLGASSHFTEEIAQQHFAIDVLGTPAEDAALDIEWLPASYSCLKCLQTFASIEAPEIATCPACGGIALETDHADVCYIREIEVEGIGRPCDFVVPASTDVEHERT